MKAYTILMALCMVVMFSCNAVEGGGAYMRHDALSRKALKEQSKIATSGLNPSVSNLSGQASSNVNGVNNNSESTNTNMSDTATAYTPTTATTTDSHHGLSVDQYRSITHNNENKP